jgi:hypothetical protein
MGSHTPFGGQEERLIAMVAGIVGGVHERGTLVGAGTVRSMALCAVGVERLASGLGGCRQGRHPYRDDGAVGRPGEKPPSDDGASPDQYRNDEQRWEAVGDLHDALPPMSNTYFDRAWAITVFIEL